MAEHTTANFALPYPDPKGKTQIGPVDIEELANRLETVLSAGATAIHEPGDIKASMSASTPEGWLPCNGQEVEQAAYPALYAALKAKWGVAAAGFFLLPNARQRFPIGAGTNLFGTIGGELEVALTGPQSGIQAHKHKLAHAVVAAGLHPVQEELAEFYSYHGYLSGASQSYITATGTTGPLPAAEAHSNLPPFFAANFYIKT